MSRLTADISAVFEKLRELAPSAAHDDHDNRVDDASKENRVQEPASDEQSESDTKVESDHADKSSTRSQLDQVTLSNLRDLERDLDTLTERVRRLKQYSSINYTGFLKIAKKHDRKKSKYKVRPLLNVRLATRPINSEQSYSMLLNQLSIIYFAVRQQLDEEQTGPLDLANQGETHDGAKYTAYKCELLLLLW